MAVVATTGTRVGSVACETRVVVVKGPGVEVLRLTVKGAKPLPASD